MSESDEDWMDTPSTAKSKKQKKKQKKKNKQQQSTAAEATATARTPAPPSDMLSHNRYDTRPHASTKAIAAKDAAQRSQPQHQPASTTGASHQPPSALSNR